MDSPTVVLPTTSLEATVDPSDTVATLKAQVMALNRANQSLREQLVAEQATVRRWQMALESTGDGLWDWNPITNEVFFSAQWKTMLGYDDHEISNHLDEWDSRVHPYDKAQCYADLEAHLRGDTPMYRNEHRMRCKDGSYKWILDRGQVIEWNAEGQPQRLIGTHTDISDRKRDEVQRQQMEVILRQSEATNQAILAAIPDLLLRVGRDGTCFMVLPPKDGVAGVFLPIQHHLSEVLPLDLLHHHLQRIEQAIATGQLQVWEQQLPKHGKTCYEEVRLMPCSDEECLVIVRDITERKQTELDLKTKIDELDRFFSVSLDLLCIADTDGYFRRINCAWERTLGYPLGELEGKSFINFVHPDDVESTLAILATLAEQKDVLNFVNRYRCQNGSYRWIEWRSVPVGPLIYAAARDITDRLQSELELKSTKDQLELVLKASSEGFSDWNTVTGEIYFSPRWKAILGYADDELENSLAMWQSVALEEDRKGATQLAEAYHAGTVDHVSLVQRYRHKDGSTVHMLTRMLHVRDDQGQVVRMIGSHLDVTATVEMQAALKTSELQLSGVLNSSLDGIMAFRSVRQGDLVIDFEWLLCNPTAADLLGRTPSQLLGTRLLDLHPQRHGDALFALCQQVVSTGQSAQQSIHYHHHNLDYWLEIIAVQLGDGLAVTCRDITPLKRSELALQQSNQRLQENVAILQLRQEEMLRLGEMNEFIQSCLTVQEAYQAIATLVTPLFPDCGGSIFIINPSRNYAERVATWGQDLHSMTEFHPQDCWALRRGRGHLVESGQAGLRCHHSDAPANAVTLCLPMQAQGETLGLFYLWSEDAAHCSLAKQHLARTVAEQLSLAIANLTLHETLQHQSIRDPLTGLFNRRYLEESLQQEIQRAQRHNQAIGIIMLDIDYFKTVNDTYGHDAGDLALQAVGKILRERVRGSDIACRYGGEEMTLILPESNLTATEQRAEALRLEIEHLRVDYQGIQIKPFTASLGVACFPHHGCTTSILIKAADGALYRAKTNGRNRVEVAHCRSLPAPRTRDRASGDRSEPWAADPDRLS
ncbi:MAG: diguanylate cyclase [Leptolyngbya sp.]|nr:diguanylate cyclase [Leptolyngbya sp.]